MADIKNPKLIWAKGGLFLALALLAASLLLLEAPSLSVAMLLAVSTWSFCRSAISRWVRHTTGQSADGQGFFAEEYRERPAAFRCGDL